MAAKAKRPRRLKLAESLDMAATVKLAGQLSGKRGAPLVVNASQVAKIGAQCLQILISARKTWASDDHSFRIVQPSQALLDSLAIVGISQSDLNIDGVAPQ